MIKNKKKLLGVDVILYLLISIIGFILLKNPELEVLKPIAYASTLYFIIAFFAIIAYFFNRRDKDYEHLIFALNSVIIGAYLFVSATKQNTAFVLGNSVLFFSLLNFINKAYHTIKLTKQNNIEVFPKTALCIMLLLLGILVINNLYNEVTMQTLVLGYYFLTFGLLSLVEPLVIYLFKFPKVQNYFDKLMNEENQREEQAIIDKANEIKSSPKEEKTKIKKVNVKKPTPKKIQEKEEKTKTKKTATKAKSKTKSVKKNI